MELQQRSKQTQGSGQPTISLLLQPPRPETLQRWWSPVYFLLLWAWLQDNNWPVARPTSLRQQKSPGCSTTTRRRWTLRALSRRQQVGYRCKKRSSRNDRRSAGWTRRKIRHDAFDTTSQGIKDSWYAKSTQIRPAPLINVLQWPLQRDNDSE